MDANSEKSGLLDDNRVQWQKIAAYLKETNVQSQGVAKIERLAIASPYALQQLQHHLDWTESLLRLEEFTLASSIIDPGADNKIDLEQVKQQLRRYRHQKMVEDLPS